MNILNFWYKISNQDIIVETAMGKESNLQFNEKNAYARSVLSMNEGQLIRSKAVQYYSDFIWYSTSMGKRQKKDLKILLDFTKSVIKERWALWKSNKSGSYWTDTKKLHKNVLQACDTLTLTLAGGLCEDPGP